MAPPVAEQGEPVLINPTCDALLESTPARFPHPQNLPRKMRRSLVCLRWLAWPTPLPIQRPVKSSALDTLDAWDAATDSARRRSGFSHLASFKASMLSASCWNRRACGQGLGDRLLLILDDAQLPGHHRWAIA